MEKGAGATSLRTADSVLQQRHIVVDGRHQRARTLPIKEAQGQALQMLINRVADPQGEPLPYLSKVDGLAVDKHPSDRIDHHHGKAIVIQRGHIMWCHMAAMSMRIQIIGRGHDQQNLLTYPISKPNPA